MKNNIYNNSNMLFYDVRKNVSICINGDFNNYHIFYKKFLINCNLFIPTKHLGVHENTCPRILYRIGIWKCWLLRRGEN